MPSWQFPTAGIPNSLTPTYNPNTSVYNPPPAYKPPPPGILKPPQASTQPHPPSELIGTVTTLTVHAESELGVADQKRIGEDRKRTDALGEAAGGKVAQAVNHAMQAEKFLRGGDLKRAFTEFDAAHLLAQASKDRSLQAHVLRGKGAAYVASGELERSLQAYGEARSLAQSLNDRNGEAETLTSMAWVYQYQGEAQKALQLYEAALPLIIHEKNKAGEVKIRVGIGLLYQSLGWPKKAAEQYVQAYSAAEANAEKAGILASIGEIYLASGLGKKALGPYKQALDLMQGQADPAAEAGILVGMGRVHMSLGDWQTALRVLEEARQRMKEAGNRTVLAGIIATTGEVFYRIAISQARSPSSDGIGDLEAMSNALASLKSDAADPSKYFRMSLKEYQNALSMMQQVNNRDGEIGVLTNIGLAYDAWDKPRNALEYYTRAIEKLEELQAAARLDEFRTQVAAQSATVYQRAILLHIRLKHPEQAFNLSERARARTFLDQLGNNHINLQGAMPAEFSHRLEALRQSHISLESQLRAEVSKPSPEVNEQQTQSLRSQIALVASEYGDLLTRLQVFDPKYDSYLRVAPLKLADVQRQLSPNATLISYFLTPNNALAFVISRESFEVAKLAVNQTELDAAIASFRDFPNLNDPSPESLRQLHKWLIAPIQRRLKTPLVGIIPNGVLHAVPFAALTDGKRYFGDAHTIFSLPSVSVLQFIPHKTGSGAASLLAIAYGEAAGQPELPHVEPEVRAIAGFYGTAPRIGEAATVGLLRDAGEYSILHLAAHYHRNSSSPGLSSVTVADGSLSLQDVYGLDLKKTELVVLSTCQSQSGGTSRGDDIEALNRAFMYAGAPTVIASLWNVDDGATAELMISFYRRLKSGSTKAAALRAAQMETRAKHQHPYYWAGFVLTGDPGLFNAFPLFAWTDDTASAAGSTQRTGY